MQPMDLGQPCKTVGNSIYQAGFEGVFPNMTICGSTDGYLEKQAGKGRQEQHFPLPPDPNSREKTTQGQGFPGNWDMLEAAGHRPHLGRASREDTGVWEGSLRGEPGKGHTGKAHLGMAT